MSTSAPCLICRPSQCRRQAACGSALSVLGEQLQSQQKQQDTALREQEAFDDATTQRWAGTNGRIGSLDVGGSLGE
jgi:hypothetical protein